MGKYVIQPHTRLQEWVADERGYFTDEGLDDEFQANGFSSGSLTTSPVRSADSVPVELRQGAFEDMSAARACHWAVSAAATSGAGRMWGGAYSVTPCGVFVPASSAYLRPEDLAGVDIAVGYHSGSHYATIQALERAQRDIDLHPRESDVPDPRVRHSGKR